MPEQPTVTTQNVYTQANIPAWAQPYFEGMAGAGQAEALRPYQAYGGPRLAGFSGAEDAAMSGIARYATQGGPGAMNAAGGSYDAMNSGLGSLMGGYGQMGGSAMDMYNQSGNQMMSGDQDWASYMQPYQQNVTNNLVRQAEQDSQRQMSQVGSAAANSGAFGGSRHGLLEGDVLRGTRQEIGDIRARGANAAFDRGMQMFEGDRAASQFGQGLGLNALNTGLGALAGQTNATSLYGNLAAGQSALGGQQQNMFFDRMGQLQQAGQAQRGLEQAGLDIGYQDFQNQNNSRMNRLSWFNSMMNGFPMPQSTNQTQSYSTQNPSLWQSALGTGVSGLGMYNAFNQG